MAQNVIASRDFQCMLNFDAIGVPYQLETGASFSATISGNTEDIGAFGTDEPIATDNGGNTYDITITLQEAEALRIKAALAAATAASPNGSIAHIRQVVEALTITAAWSKYNDVPATTTLETYTRCTGVEESDNVERRGTETLKTWRFRARGMMTSTIPI